MAKREGIKNMIFHFPGRRQNTILKTCHSLLAEVVELVDALDSGSSGCNACGGSSPPFRTILLLFDL